MTSYFPLLPSISSKSISKIINSSTTLLNHSNNFRESNKSKNHCDSIYIGTYKLEGLIWQLISIQECEYARFIDIKRNSLNVKSDQMVVSLFRLQKKFPKLSRILPKPDSLRIDSSPVAERGSLNYHFEDTTTTYQGEYPFDMTNINNGSFWSFDTLKEDLTQDDNIQSFLILMNINRDAEKQNEVDLDIYDPHKKDKVLHWKARQNSFTIINIRDIQKKLQFEQIHKTFFIQCKRCTFIPMVLSVDIKNNQLSFEHTHPPSELLWGRDKFKVIKFIKERWISN